MRVGSRQGLGRLGKKAALQAIFNAFKWLAGNGASRYTVDWLGDYPLLSVDSQRDAILISRFLHPNANEGGDRAFTYEPFMSATFLGDHDSARLLAEKGSHTAIAYLDYALCSQYSVTEALLDQRRTIRELFAEEHDSEELIIVRGDNLHSNGYNSIREIITNLIAAWFFISKGYLVLEDTGSGPDVIALKTRLVQELRERGFMGRGGSLSQLATIRALGKVKETYSEVISQDELIAVESESFSPRKGMKQLIEGYKGSEFSYTAFFDRRVIAAPFLYCGSPNLDLLTYDANGIEYRKRREPLTTTNFWANKKHAFINHIEDSIKSMLLLNLTFEEMASMVSEGPRTPRCIFSNILKLKTERILDKVESVL